MKTMATAMVLAAGFAVCGCVALGAAAERKTVVVWSEGTAPKNLYPADINGAIAKGLRASDALKGWEVVTANLSGPYAVPPTDEVPFTGVQVHKNGTREPAKMGFCWKVGKARFFYFQLGHETNPIYFDPEIRKIMANAVLWAAGTP